MTYRVEKTNWRDWSDCTRISNKHCEIIICASAGGRVLLFSIDGKNIIYENESQNGKTLNDWKTKSFDPDAGRFDYGPEKITQSIHARTWMGKWTTEITGDFSVKLTSVVDSTLGLISIREFILHPDSAVVTIRQIAKNISKKPMVRHFWGRTLVKPDGYLWMPLNSSSHFSNGWAQFMWKPDRIETNPAADERIQMDNHNFRFHANGSTIKGGTDATIGWQAYVLNDLVFVKRFQVYPANDYSGSDHFTGIFFSNGKFCELEPCSQTYTIQPGNSIEFTERWELSIHTGGWSPDKYFSKFKN